MIGSCYIAGSVQGCTEMEKTCCVCKVMHLLQERCSRTDDQATQPGGHQTRSIAGVEEALPPHYAW